MTNAEYRHMYLDHLSRDFSLSTDQLLQRAVLAGFARRHGRSFLYLYATGDNT